MDEQVLAAMLEYSGWKVQEIHINEWMHWHKIDDNLGALGETAEASSDGQNEVWLMLFVHEYVDSSQHTLPELYDVQSCDIVLLLLDEWCEILINE